MGVESGSLEVRKSLLKRLMPDSVIVQGFKEFEKTSIRISANNIIRFPGETRDDIFRTIEINRQINPDSIVVLGFLHEEEFVYVLAKKRGKIDPQFL